MNEVLAILACLIFRLFEYQLATSYLLNILSVPVTRPKLVNMVLPAHSQPQAGVMSHFNLSGKSALVTGGCRGIGLEKARGLTEAGAQVAITSTRTKPKDADEIAEQLSTAANGVLVKAYKCDVRNKADVEVTVA